MALPLIMMAGAGILSGAQYLMNKVDKREGESMIADFRDQNYQDPFFQEYGNQYMAMADDQGFFDASNVQRAHDMRQQYVQDRQAWQGRQDILAQERFNQVNTSENVAYQRIKPTEDRYANITSEIKKVIPALDDPGMSGMDVYQATLGMLRTLLPGENIMEGDVSAAINAGGLAAELARGLMRVDSGATMDATWRSDVRSILERVHRAEKERFDAVRYNAEQYLQRKDGNIDNVIGWSGADANYYVPPAGYQPPVQPQNRTTTPAEDDPVQRLRPPS